jgi:heat shock protein HtpX
LKLTLYRSQTVNQAQPNIKMDLWECHAWRNHMQTIILLVAMGGYLALLGWLLFGFSGLIAFIVIGVAAAVFNPTVAPQLVMRMYRATPLTPSAVPELANAMVQLSKRAELDHVPTLYYVPSKMMNAFAVGSPKRAAVGLTDGLLRGMNGRQLAGVLAHEISHIRNNDLWVMGLADLFSRAMSFLSVVGMVLLLLKLPLIVMGITTVSWWAILMLIFGPGLISLTQLALSRTREFDADLNAALLTGDPQGLASALHLLERLQGGWLERVVMPGRHVPEPSLLRTHPKTEERIERLMNLTTDPQPQLAPVVVPHLQRVAVRPVQAMPRWRVSGLWY